MMRLVFTISILVATTFVSAEDCPLKDKLDNGIEAGYIPCKENPCDEDSKYITDLTECLRTRHCFVLGDKCSSKIPANFQLEKGIESSGLEQLLSPTPEDNKSDLEERFFNFGGNNNNNPNIFPSCQPYLSGCQININNPASILEALTPPVDIPYCLRIPCDPMMPSLELDRNACVRRPGCYFDSELSNLRQLVGQQVLAGVPVCQLAIRNKNFLSKVRNEKMMDGTPFNGLYSKCYIRQNPLQPNPGCPVVSTLEYFGYAPKHAGWEGITTEECLYIDGCPTPQGCMLPADISSVRVRSATIDNPGSLSERERYGQPICQPFDMNMNNPKAFVNDYNKCLQSGCIVSDEITSSKIISILYQLVQQSGLNTLSKFLLLQGIMNGNIGPQNILEKLNGSTGNCPTNNLNGLGDLSSLFSGSNNLNLLSLLGPNGFNGLGILPTTNQGNNQGTNNILPFSLDLSDDNTDSDNKDARLFGLNSNLPGSLGATGSTSGGFPGFLGTNTGTGGTSGGFPGFLGTNTGTGGTSGGFPGFLGTNTGTGSTSGGFPGFLGTNTGTGSTSGGFPGFLGTNTGTGSTSGGFPGFLGTNTGLPGTGSGFPGFGTNGGGNIGVNDILQVLGISGGGFPGMNNFGCPYSVPNIRGFPQLKGRFTDCCKITTCYYPRTTILKQYSGIASYYSQWGGWSTCSATCGQGRQSRKRQCITVNNQPCDIQADGKDVEERICGTQPCPTLSNWFPWSGCSVTCGLGVRERFRTCEPQTADCGAPLKEIEECTAPVSCPVFGSWTEFGPCDSDCGFGSKLRTRDCISGCDLVTPEDLEESVSCYTVNGEVKTTVKQCLPFPKCYSEVVIECLKSDGSPGCCGENFVDKIELRRCVVGTCRFCEMSNFERFCDSKRKGLSLA